MRRFLELRHPAQLVTLAFALGILAGTGLLLLPVATAGPGSASVLTAAFTSTSAICVTGLIVVDTATYWSHFGQAVVMVLVQIGGLGIMTLASMLALVVARRLGLRSPQPRLFLYDAEAIRPGCDPDGDPLQVPG